tara:strand:- start:12 stop:332 length:321 start_codon:yes stop_codon:yes gene_type:complete
MDDIKKKYRKVANQDGFVKLLDEKYNGVVVSVGRISFDDTSDNSKTATLNYEYDLVECPKNIEIEKEDEEFHNFLGDIIVDIIETTLEQTPDLLNYKEKNKEKNED